MVKHGIDFHKIHWGAFTKQFQKRKNKNIKTLKSFANHIIKNPKFYNAITLKRANFYKHVINGGMIGGGDRGDEEYRRHFGEATFNPNPDAPFHELLRDNRGNAFIGPEEDPMDYGSVNSSGHHYGSDMGDTIPSEQSSIKSSMHSINPSTISSKSSLHSINSTNPSIQHSIKSSKKSNKQNFVEAEQLHTNIEPEIEEAKKIDIENLFKKGEKFKYLIDIQKERNKHYSQKINEMNVILFKSGSLYFRNGIEFIFPQKKIKKLTKIILTEGMLELSYDCRNKDLAFVYYRQIYPSMSVGEILSEIWQSGKGLEYALSGRNNPISNLIFRLNTNNFQVVDFTISQMYNYVISKLSKVFDKKKLPKGASAGSAPIDLYDDENNILNEVKDFWDKDFESQYNNNIIDMQELYEELFLLREKGEIEIDGYKIDELLNDNELFKLYFYKNNPYCGFKVQLAKFPPTDHNLTKSKLNKYSDDTYIKYIYGGDFKQIFNEDYEVIRWESIKGQRAKGGETKEYKEYNKLMNKYLKSYLKGKNVFHLTINTNNILATINLSKLLKKYNGQLGTIFRCEEKKIIIPWTEFTICGSARNNKVEQTIDKWISKWKKYSEVKLKMTGEKTPQDLLDYGNYLLNSKSEIESNISNIEKEIITLEQEKELKEKNKKPTKAIQNKITKLENEMADLLLKEKDLIKTYNKPPYNIL